MTSASDEHLLTADGQILWRGTLLGSGTSFRLVDLQGWLSLPGQRGSNQPIPSRHGAYPGRKLSSERIITAELVARTRRAEFPAAVDALRKACSPGEDPQEEPLVIRLQGQSWMTWARCVRREIPGDVQFANGHTTVSLQWEATDPRIYAAAESAIPAGLPAPAVGGLDFGAGGLDFSGGGLDFGSTRSGGLVRALNTGDVPTWPIIEITGPCPGPVVTFGGDRTLRFDPAFTVAAGQVLTIHTRPGVRTVELNGVSVRPRLWSRQWTPLEPGIPTDIRFTAADYNPAARMTVRWRHAKH